MNQPAHVDDLASIDTSSDPEPWLRMLRGMWPGDERKQGRYRRLFGKLELPRNYRALEVGCGAGGASRLLANSVPESRLVVGVDPSQLAVAEASRLTGPDRGQARRGPTYLAMDGRRLAFADGAFDGVFCTRVLIHALDPEAIVAEMARVLRTGGRVLIVEPDRDGMLSSVDCDQVNRAFWSERRSVNPRIGRKLYPMLREMRLSIEHVEPLFHVSLQPPTEDQVRALERELIAGQGEWWSLVEAGRISSNELRTYVASMRRARESGACLRTELEMAYVARKVF